jgi:predicted phosphodiesterase
MLFVHGSPADPIGEYLYPGSDLARFGTLPFDLVAVGHTHRPWISTVGAVTVVNVGSCGLPRDFGSLACCLVHDTRTLHTEVLRVQFDAEAVIAEAGDAIDASVIACLRRSPESTRSSARG